MRESASIQEVAVATKDELGSMTELQLTEEDLAGKNAAEQLSMRKRVAFLRAFALKGIVTEGCRAAGVSRETVKYWRKDAWFEERYQAALEEAGDLLEREAHRRAVEGIDEPIIFQGMPTMITDEDGNERPLTVKKYSDPLLTLLLKASRPDKYRENVKTTHEVAQGGVLIVPGAVSPEAWTKVAAEQQARYAGKKDGEK